MSSKRKYDEAESSDDEIENLDNEEEEEEEEEEKEGEEETESSEEEEEDDETFKKRINGGKERGGSEVPLWMRLNNLDNEEVEESSSLTKIPTKITKRKHTRDIQDEKSKAFESNKKEANQKEGRLNKNAPAVMKSNKPVRRLRIDANNTTRKSRDPRFTEGSGELKHDKFLQAYQFLDKYQEDEINNLTKSLKKKHNPEDQEELKAELFKRKQEMTERRRSLKIKARLTVAKSAEREKVKNGKTPFFMNRNAKKVIALEERFDELKGEGKLNSFLQKKRKKNANKDHRWLPSRRQES